MEKTLKLEIKVKKNINLLPRKNVNWSFILTQEKFMETKRNYKKILRKNLEKF